MSLFFSEFPKSEFYSKKRWVTRGPVADIDFLINHGMKQVVPLATTDVLSTGKLRSIATNVDECRAECLGPPQTEPELFDDLRCSSRIQIISGPPLGRDGRRYLDGAITAAVPLEFALEAGHTHVLVLCTRSLKAERRKESVVERLIAWRLNRYQRGLGKVFLERVERWERLASDLLDPTSMLHKQSQILVIYPPDPASEVGQLEQSRSELERGCREGFELVCAALNRSLPTGYQYTPQLVAHWD